MQGPTREGLVHLASVPVFLPCSVVRAVVVLLMHQSAQEAATQWLAVLAAEAEAVR